MGSGNYGFEPRRARLIFKWQNNLLFRNRHDFEIRVYTNQHNFEIAVGMTPRFKNIEEITRHVISKYPKSFN